MNKLKLCTFFLVLWHMMIIQQAYALVPLESFLLGDLTQQQMDKKFDPIEYIFTGRNAGEIADEYRQVMSIFRAHVNEGATLKNSCRFTQAPEYSQSWPKHQATKAFMSAFQYLILDVTVRALATYSKKLEWPDQDYQVFTDNLVKNFCSANITLIARDQIKKNLMAFRQSNLDFQLPSVKKSPFFPEKLEAGQMSAEIYEHEMLLTTELFKAACSWAGDIDNPRLMTSVFRDPVAAAFVMRQMTGEQFHFNANTGEVFTKSSESTASVLCENLICRKRNKVYFEKYFPRMIGSQSIKEDLRRIYCHTLLDIDDGSGRESSKVVSGWLKAQTFDDDNLMLAQWHALITSVPNFMLRVKSYDQLKNLLSSSFDHIWDRWAAKQINNFSKDLYLEEPIAVELVDRAYYFRDRLPEFAIYLDVNVGEIDRSVNIKGKIQSSVQLKFTKTFLSWIRNEWQGRDPRYPDKMKHLEKTMIRHVEDSIDKAREQFKRPAWDGNLSSIVAKEILTQLDLYKGRFFDISKNQQVVIPVTFSFGPYALKYINFQARIDREKNRLDYSTYEYND